MSGVVQSLLGSLTITSSLASISGNLLLLLLLLRREPGDLACRSVAVSATLSDLSLGLLAMPLLAMALLGGATPLFSTASCQSTGFLLVLLITGSGNTHCLAAAQRGAQLLLALRYGTVWTACRLRVVLLAAWLVAALWAALPLAGVGHYTHHSSAFAFLPCGPSLAAGGRGWAVAWLLLGGVPPRAAACWLVGRSVGVAWRQDRRGTFVCNHLHCYKVHTSRFLRSSIAMATGPVCLLLCWLPFICVSFFEIISERQPPAHIGALSTWLLLSSTALNPWITCLTQIRYREPLHRIFARLRPLSPCGAVAPEEEPCPQSSTFRLDTTNCISTATNTAAAAATQASRV